MFAGCSSLVTLDLINLDTSNITNYDKVFLNCYKNLIICINEDKTANLLSNLSSYNNNCSYFCQGQKTKFQTDICIGNYSSSDYKNEYNNIWYKECPKGTNSSSFNLYLYEKNIFDVSNNIHFRKYWNKY